MTSDWSLGAVHGGLGRREDGGSDAGSSWLTILPSLAPSFVLGGSFSYFLY